MSGKFWLALVGCVVALLLLLGGLACVTGLAIGIRSLMHVDSAPAWPWWILALGLFLLALIGTIGFAYLGERSGFWTVANPFAVQVCPVCFGHMSLGDCRIVSAFDSTHVIEGAPRGLARAVRRILIPTLAGEYYAQTGAARACPTCASLLPNNLEYADSVFVALVGATGAGKSLYASAVIHELENESVRAGIGCVRFGALNNEVQDRYDGYYARPLFGEHRPIGPTPPPASGQFVPPLTYVMDFERNGRTRRVNLMLYDGSGEGLENEATLAHTYRYVANASAILFLIDPLALPRVTAKLPPHLRPATPTRNIDPAALLASVTRAIQLARRAIHGAGLLDIPLAITLAKADLFHWLDPRAQFAFLSDPSYVNGPNRADQSAIDEQVQHLISQYGGASVLQSAAVFADRAFFAVSSTGSPEIRGQFATISPRRTLDPLLWILGRLGIIE